VVVLFVVAVVVVRAQVVLVLRVPPWGTAKSQNRRSENFLQI
jgi:hypothetical protein